MSDESVRNEIFAKKLGLKGKNYFFSVKEAKNGNKYMAITEMQYRKGQKLYSTIFVFDNDIADFKQAFEDSLSAIEQAVSTQNKD